MKNFFWLIALSFGLTLLACSGGDKSAPADDGYDQMNVVHGKVKAGGDFQLRMTWTRKTSSSKIPKRLHRRFQGKKISIFQQKT